MSGTQPECRLQDVLVVSLEPTRALDKVPQVLGVNSCEQTPALDFWSLIIRTVGHWASSEVDFKIVRCGMFGRSRRSIDNPAILKAWTARLASPAARFRDRFFSGFYFGLLEYLGVATEVTPGRHFLTLALPLPSPLYDRFNEQNHRKW